MGNEMFAKFDEMFDVAGLADDIAKISTNTKKERVKVPHGDYEVSIANLELGLNEFEGENFGFPMIKIWFNVLDGEFKDNYIYWNTTVNGKADAFKLRTVKDFLESLGASIPVDFVNFVHLGDLLKQMSEELKEAEYQLSYTVNAKGFNTYTIVQRFK